MTCGLSLGGGLKCLQIAHILAPQKPAQTLARNSFTQKFICNHKQVIQCQELGAPQVHHDSCLSRGKGGLQSLSGV